MRQYLALLSILLGSIFNNFTYANPTIPLLPPDSTQSDEEPKNVSPQEANQSAPTEVDEDDMTSQGKETETEENPNFIDNLSSPEEDTPRIIKHTATQSWKYGISLNFGSFCKNLGLFIEYKHKVLGLELGLSWFRHSYMHERVPSENKEDYPILSYQSLAIPIILNIYPGPARQFAIRLGISSFYTLAGRTLILNPHISNKDYIDEDETDLFLRSLKKRIKTWDLVILWGLGYETDIGIITGMDVLAELDPTLRRDKQDFITAFTLHVGFNVAPFFY